MVGRKGTDFRSAFRVKIALRRMGKRGPEERLARERQLEERTQWALALQKEKETAVADFQHVAAEAEKAARHIQSLEKNLAEARAARAKIESSLWTRAGRKLGAV